MFFFQVLQMLCTPICKTNNSFASCEGMIVGFHQEVRQYGNKSRDMALNGK